MGVFAARELHGESMELGSPAATAMSQTLFAATAPVNSDEEVKGRTALAGILCPQASVVRFEDRTADRKPKSESVPLGRDEGLEYLIKGRLRDAVTPICH